MAKIALLYFCVSESRKTKMIPLVQALTNGIKQQGQEVDIFNGFKDSLPPLRKYKYLIFGSETMGIFSARIPEGIIKSLETAGSVTSIRSFVFIKKRGFFSLKALIRFMNKLEQLGLIIRNSAVFKSEEEANDLGKQLKVFPEN